MSAAVCEVPVGSYTALVDQADYALVARYRWRPKRSHNGKIYAQAHLPGRNGGSIFMHRLIVGDAAGPETDHENDNGLDNRRTNLRPATASQNRANRGKPRLPGGRLPTSRFKGVSRGERQRKWLAQITVAGVNRKLGRFASEEDAARVYDAAAIAAWGEFARLNFPEANG